MRIVDADCPLRIAIGEDDVLLREGIAQTLLIGQASVEKHVTAIFRKLRIAPADTEHRRVQAVLTYLRADECRR